jgi:uncharacterized alpha/beta hydrolase family protein
MNPGKHDFINSTESDWFGASNGKEDGHKEAKVTEINISAKKESSGESSSANNSTKQFHETSSPPGHSKLTLHQKKGSLKSTGKEKKEMEDWVVVKETGSPSNNDKTLQEVMEINNKILKIDKFKDLVLVNPNVDLGISYIF